MKLTLLLDADIIAYQLAAKAQATYSFPGFEPATRVDDWGDVAPRVDDVVSALTAKLKADAILVCLSCPTVENWRLNVLPTYKGNRAGSVKPELLAAVKDYMEATWPSYRRPTLEADDIMGILSTDPKLVPGKKVIVSEDKDMATIPGWLFNPRKDTKPRLVGSVEADQWHLTQTLTGDTVDGYTGCPGIGARHKRLLAAEPLDWATVVTLYASKGLTESDALVQARVARICRSSDYDFKRKEVILWNPATS